MNTPHKKILIYRLGSLGDTVIALPCFHKIRECFPDAEITLLTNRPVMSKAAPLEAVLGNKYFFDRVMDYPVGTRNPWTLVALLKRIRSLEIDTVINLTAARSRMSAYRDYLFFRVAGVANMIGFPKDQYDFEVHHDKVTGNAEWEAFRLSRRINALGDIDMEKECYWDLKLTAAELNAANKAIGKISPGSLMLAACVGTKMQSKDWGIHNWLALFTRLGSALPNWKLVLVGAADEVPLADECLAAWGGEGLNLCGTTTPRISAAVLQQANIFLGHDSGPMHLAASVGTPCVAIFSARSLPGQWFPRGKDNRILYNHLECAGCGLELCVEKEKKCLVSITIHDVETAVIELVNGKKQIIQKKGCVPVKMF